MLEPDDLARMVMEGDERSQTLAGLLDGKTVMISAGPTREALDSVRYITNRSSGKMGYAMAEAARDAGANVILLSGPVNLERPTGMTVIDIESADDLAQAAHDNAASADLFIAAAAVADYKPAQAADRKMKKSDEEMTIDLVRTPDTLAQVSALAMRPFCVGFAAETNDVREYAAKKMAKKNLDMIIANQVGEGLAFDQDDNAVHVMWGGGEQAFPTTSKRDLAVQLVKLIADRYHAGAANPSNVTPIAASE